MCPQPFVCVFHDTVMTFPGQLLMCCIRMPLCLGFSAVSSCFNSCIWGRNITERLLCSSQEHITCATLGGTWCLLVSLPVMLTVIAWLRWGVCQVSSRKAPVFLFEINQLSGRKILEDNVNIWFSLKLSLTNFGIHWSFLPESNISMMVVKWSFSNCQFFFKPTASGEILLVPLYL